MANNSLLNLRRVAEPVEFSSADPARATSARDLVPDAIDPRVLALADYWLRIRPAPGRLPGRHDLDPIDIPNLLSVIFLVDLERAPTLRFRWRLRGTQLEFISGREYNGQYFDQTYRDFQHSPMRRQLTAAANGAACWWYGDPAAAQPTDVTHAERLVLPLAADGHIVDMIVGLTVFTLTNRR